MPYERTIWPGDLTRITGKRHFVPDATAPEKFVDEKAMVRLKRIEDGIYDSLAHSGKVYNVAEFLRRYPGSDTGGTQEALDQADTDGGGMVFIPAGTISYDTTINVPENILLTGAGWATVLSYTGSGNAVAMNASSVGGFDLWRSIVEKFKITSTTATAGIYSKNLYETIIQQVLFDGVNDGFTTAAIVWDASGAEGAEFCNKIHQCSMRRANGNAIRITGTRDAHNQNVISENRIQGSKSYGIFADARVSGFNIIANDCEGNVTAEMRFEGGANALNLIGNFMETGYDPQDGIQLTGTDEFRAINMLGNKFVNAADPPNAGSALTMDGTHADGYVGIIFKGNEMQYYGVGIDFGGKEYYGCDFESNSYVACGARYANLPAVASEVMILRRLSGSKTWDPAAFTGIDSTEVDVDGAVVGDFVKAAFTTQGNNDILISAHVSRADKVLVILLNKTGGEINLPEGTLYVEVQKIARA